MTKDDPHKKLVAFDFFCGCGGTSRGFQKAGINVVFALDIDPDAKNTFSLNFPDTTFYKKSITKVTDSDLKPTLEKYKDSYKLFCGCAPCQPFTKQNTTSPKRETRRSLLSRFGIII